MFDSFAVNIVLLSHHIIRAHHRTAWSRSNAVDLYSTVLWLNPSWDIGYPDRVLIIDTSYLQTDAGIVTLLDHYRFLPNPLRFINYHPSLYTENVLNLRVVQNAQPR